MWDIFDAKGKRLRTANEDIGALSPGEYHMTGALALMDGAGRYLVVRDEKENQGFLSFDVPEGKNSLNHCVELLQTLGAEDFSPVRLRMLDHQLIEELRAAVTVFWAEAEPKEAERLSALGEWLLPEDILSSVDMIQGLSRQLRFSAVEKRISRLSGEKRVPRGMYRDRQGNEFEVMGIAVHTESGAPLVIYQGRRGGGLLAQPVVKWMKPVRTADGEQPRYAPERE